MDRVNPSFERGDDLVSSGRDAPVRSSSIRDQGATSWRRVRRLALALLVVPLVAAAGCQGFSGPLTQWRHAYDSSLFKGVDKEELADISGPADSQNLFDRWVTPRRPATASRATRRARPSFSGQTAGGP